MPRPPTTRSSISRKRNAISLGRSRNWIMTPTKTATTVAPRKKNAPVTCKNSSQSYLLTRQRDSTSAFGRQDSGVDVSQKHLQLLTETIEAVNSTLDLEE